MSLSAFVTPDPQTRRDGWSPERKVRFLDSLAARGNVRAACAAVGMSREAAYTLRRRDALFARGWAAALVLARESSVEVLADKAIDGIEEEIWYRGEQVGTKRRFDARLLLAHIARLDRMVEEQAATGAADAARFDEILACVAGAEIPAELQCAEDPLPLDRETLLVAAEDHAAATVEAAWIERDAEKDDGRRTDEEHTAYEDELEAETDRARAAAAARWDAWFAGACREIDDLRARCEAESAAAAASARTVSEVSGSSGAATAIGPDGRLYAYA